MLKQFFKALAGIWENIRFVVSMVFLLVIGTAPLWIACAITARPELRLLVIIVVLAFELWMFTSGRRILKSTKYAKKHDCTYKEAYRILSMTEHMW